MWSCSCRSLQAHTGVTAGLHGGRDTQGETRHCLRTDERCRQHWLHCGPNDWGPPGRASRWLLPHLNDECQPLCPQLWYGHLSHPNHVTCCLGTPKMADAHVRHYVMSLLLFEICIWNFLFAKLIEDCMYN